MPGSETTGKTPPQDPGTSLDLAERLRLQIRANGPVSLATFMSLCLTHPEHGYYKTRDPLGKKGDFITAPEVSQMFGEMLGIWTLMQWASLGKPQKFDLLELGPGKGTLMADVVRVLRSDPRAMAALNIVLLETNPVLIRAQREKLAPLSVRWIKEIDELEDDGPALIVLANEFFDALPIRQFQFQNASWHERLIGLQGEHFIWGLSPAPVPPGTISPAITDPQEHAIWETSDLARNTTARIARLLNKRSGAMMIIDYGHQNSRTGDTFQAIANHEFADPLQDPGHADLSAHVDFEALSEAARSAGASAHFAGTQGQVLSGLGIHARARNLIEANPDKEEEISAALQRLTDPDQMGEMFKVMIVSGASPAPCQRDETLATISKVSHGFFGRKGGVSQPPYASLNVSQASDDAPDNVRNNRAIAAASLHIPFEKLATLNQVHSAKVVTIRKNHDFSSRPPADAMVCKTPGIGLGILTADCVPVLFADPEAGVIGACHAGWQGALAGVVSNTIEQMEALGAKRTRIIAAIGPAISPQNYEVGPEWAENASRKNPDAARFILPPESGMKERFDLPGFVRNELKKNSLAHVGQIQTCTYGHPDLYFSHRFATHNDEQTGRQISLIALKAG